MKQSNLKSTLTILTLLGALFSSASWAAVLPTCGQRSSGVCVGEGTAYDGSSIRLLYKQGDPAACTDLSQALCAGSGTLTAYCVAERPLFPLGIPVPVEISCSSRGANLVVQESQQ